MDQPDHPTKPIRHHRATYIVLDGAVIRPAVSGEGASTDRKFRESRRQALSLAFGSSIFVAGGVGMIASHDSLGWFVAAFFGLGVAVGLAQLIAPATLTLTSSSVSVINKGRKATYSLADCGEFRVWNNPSARNSIVVFDYAGASQSRRARAAWSPLGATAAFSGTFGLGASQLAAILNDARSKSRSTASSAPDA